MRAFDVLLLRAMWLLLSVLMGTEKNRRRAADATKMQDVIPGVTKQMRSGSTLSFFWASKLFAFL